MVHRFVNNVGEYFKISKVFSEISSRKNQRVIAILDRLSPRVIAILDGPRFSAADPAIGELSFFHKELGNMDQGIVLPQRNEKIR